MYNGYTRGTMTQKKGFIPNPNKISQTEKGFLLNSSPELETKSSSEKKIDKFKGRMISMSDSFFEQLNEYLKDNPTEGNRSSFIVRVVAKYIEQKHKENM